MIDRDHIRALTAREAERFTAERPRSLALAAEARRTMPNGVPMAWMAGLYRHPPVFAATGSGAHFTDVDGRRYLDMNQADLSMNCGYGPPAVVEAVAAQMARGSQFLLPTEDAAAVSVALGARFGLPFWQFTLSAASANTEAIRLARLATGRDEILLFDGKYHGHIDDTLVGRHGDAVTPEGLGLPGDAGRRTRVVAFNDLEAAEAALRHGTVACVVTEPALTNVGVVQPDPGFLEGLRALTRAHGALLILDETHTQVCAFGGLIRAWGLDPDIVTLGKTIGGGVPLGAWGMTEGLARTVEEHLESDVAETPGLALGGTLYGNALSLAAARAALTRVMTEDAYARTAALGARLADGIQAAVDRHGLPWTAQRLFARSGLSYARSLPRTAAEARAVDDPALTDLRRLYMANRGVWEAIATAGPAASFPMVEADIDLYLDVLEAFLGEFAG